MTESNQEAAQRLQEKFSFYVIALTFTILGLAVQTAEFGISRISDSVELLGWIFLLTSGLTGLSRLEWTPKIYQIFHGQDSLNEDHKTLKNHTSREGGN